MIICNRCWYKEFQSLIVLWLETNFLLSEEQDRLYDFKSCPLTRLSRFTRRHQRLDPPAPGGSDKAENSVGPYFSPHSSRNWRTSLYSFKSVKCCRVYNMRRKTVPVVTYAIIFIHPDLPNVCATWICDLFLACAKNTFDI